MAQNFHIPSSCLEQPNIIADSCISLTLAAGIIGVKFLNQGKNWKGDALLLTLSLDDTVRLWDLSTKSCIQVFALSPSQEPQRDERSIADVQSLTDDEENRTVQDCLMEDSSDPSDELLGFVNILQCIAIHPDDERSLVAGTSSGELVVWEIRWENLRRVSYPMSRWKSHDDSVTSVVWSTKRHGDLQNKTQLLVSGAKDGSIAVWKIFDGDHSLLRKLLGHEGMISELQLLGFPKAASKLVHEDSEEELLLQFSTRKSGLFGKGNLVKKENKHKQSTMVLSSSYDGRLRVWDIQTGTFFQLNKSSSSKNQEGSLLSLAISPCESLLVSGDESGTAQIWQLSYQLLLKALKRRQRRGSTRFSEGEGFFRELIGHGGAVTNVRWSHDSQRIITACSDSLIRIWETWTGECLRIFPVAQSSIMRNETGLSDEGSVLAASGLPPVIQVDFSAHDLWIAGASNQNTQVTVWNLAPTPFTSTLAAPLFPTLPSEKDFRQRRVIFSCMSSNKQFVVVVYEGDADIWVWDSYSAQLIRRLTTAKHDTENSCGVDSPWMHSENVIGIVTCVEISEDCRLLVAGSDYGNIFCWKLDAMIQNMRNSFAVNTTPVVGYHSMVTKVCSVRFLSSESKEVFVPGAYSSLVVSASQDGAVRLWNMSLGQCLQELVIFDDPIVKLVISCCDNPNVSTGYNMVEAMTAVRCHYRAIVWTSVSNALHLMQFDLETDRPENLSVSLLSSDATIHSHHHGGEVVDIAMSPRNGYQLLVHRRRTLKATPESLAHVWQLPKQHPFHHSTVVHCVHLSTPGIYLQHLNISPDGDCLVGISASGLLLVWSLMNKKCILRTRVTVSTTADTSEVAVPIAGKTPINQKFASKSRKMSLKGSMKGKSVRGVLDVTQEEKNCDKILEMTSLSVSWSTTFTNQVQSAGLEGIVIGTSQGVVRILDRPMMDFSYRNPTNTEEDDTAVDNSVYHLQSVSTFSFLLALQGTLEEGQERGHCNWTRYRTMTTEIGGYGTHHHQQMETLPSVDTMMRFGLLEDPRLGRYILRQILSLHASDVLAGNVASKGDNGKGSNQIVQFRALVLFGHLLKIAPTLLIYPPKGKKEESESESLLALALRYPYAPEAVRVILATYLQFLLDAYDPYVYNVDTVEIKRRILRRDRKRRHLLQQQKQRDQQQHGLSNMGLRRGNSISHFQSESNAKGSVHFSTTNSEGDRMEEKKDYHTDEHYHNLHVKEYEDASFRVHVEQVQLPTQPIRLSQYQASLSSPFSIGHVPLSHLPYQGETAPTCLQQSRRSLHISDAINVEDLHHMGKKYPELLIWFAQQLTLCRQYRCTMTPETQRLPLEQSTLIVGSNYRCERGFWTMDRVLKLASMDVEDEVAMTMVPYLIPIRNIAGRTSRFLDVLIESVEKLDNLSVFDHEVIQTLVQFKWNTLIRYLFLRDFVLVFVYMVLYLTQVVIYASLVQKIEQNLSKDEYQGVMLGFVITMLMTFSLMIYFLGKEVLQMRIIWLQHIAQYKRDHRKIYVSTTPDSKDCDLSRKVDKLSSSKSNPDSINISIRSSWSYFAANTWSSEKSKGSKIYSGPCESTIDDSSKANSTRQSWETNFGNVDKNSNDFGGTNVGYSGNSKNSKLMKKRWFRRWKESEWYVGIHAIFNSFLSDGWNVLHLLTNFLVIITLSFEIITVFGASVEARKAGYIVSSSNTSYVPSFVPSRLPSLNPSFSSIPSFEVFVSQGNGNSPLFSGTYSPSNLQYSSSPSPPPIPSIVSESSNPSLPSPITTISPTPQGFQSSIAPTSVMSSADSSSYTIATNNPTAISPFSTPPIGIGSSPLTLVPSILPTMGGSRAPTNAGSLAPTVAVSAAPTIAGSPAQATDNPTQPVPPPPPPELPTFVATSANPTNGPTVVLSESPTWMPSVTPTVMTSIPTVSPTSASPTEDPTATPTVTPSMRPTEISTIIPTMVGSPVPTNAGSRTPTMAGSRTPTMAGSAPPPSNRRRLQSAGNNSPQPPTINAPISSQPPNNNSPPQMAVNQQTSPPVQEIRAPVDPGYALNLDRPAMLTASVTMPFFACEILFYLGGLPWTAPLVRMLIKVTQGTATFLVVLLLMLVTFAGSFLVLFINLRSNSTEVDQIIEENEVIAQYSRFELALSQVYGFLFGTFTVDDFTLSRSASLATLLLFMFLFFVVIIMLNLLIAMMADKYDEVQERAVAEAMYAKAKLVWGYDVFLRYLYGKSQSRRGHKNVKESLQQRNSTHDYDTDNMRDDDTDVDDGAGCAPDWVRKYCFPRGSLFPVLSLARACFRRSSKHKEPDSDDDSDDPESKASQTCDHSRTSLNHSVPAWQRRYYPAWIQVLRKEALDVSRNPAQDHDSDQENELISGRAHNNDKDDSDSSDNEESASSKLHEGHLGNNNPLPHGRSFSHWKPSTGKGMSQSVSSRKAPQFLLQTGIKPGFSSNNNASQWAGKLTAFKRSLHQETMQWQDSFHQQLSIQEYQLASMLQQQSQWMEEQQSRVMHRVESQLVENRELMTLLLRTLQSPDSSHISNLKATDT